MAGPRRATVAATHDPAFADSPSVAATEPLDSPDEPRVNWAGRIAATAALLASIAWIGGMLWWAWPGLGVLAPVGIAGFGAALVGPPLLFGIVCLLGLRTGPAAARRFARTSHALRAEAASLERTVAGLSHTIDANRLALADQTQAMMAAGDAAAARLGDVTRGMAGQIDAGEAMAKRLSDAASAAQSNLGILLASLPRAHDETTALAGLLEQTGVSAGRHAAALDAQLVALAERGREADSLVGGAAQRLAAQISRMEATGETAGARLEQVTAAMSHAVDGLLARTADAVDEARKGISAQGEAMLAMVDTSQAALDRVSSDGAAALTERIAAIDTMTREVAARLDEHRRASERIVDGIDRGIAQIDAKLAAFHADGIDRTQALAASIGALGGSADAMAKSLKGSDAVANAAIGTTERVLAALDSVAREVDETLPEALARLEARIAGSRRAVSDAGPELLGLVTAAESTHDAVAAIADVVASQRDTLDKLSVRLLDSLAAGRAQAGSLGESVDEAILRSHRFAEEAAPRLVDALLRVRDTASAAADRARETLATVIPEAAAALEAATTDALVRAATGGVERQLAAIGEASDTAAAAAARASEQLTLRMLEIGDTTARIDERLEQVRAEREHADRDTFSRRVSLLIEALNSASIDITRAFSVDVSDSSWTAYLKGDRGIFTRRAVRLLDGGDAREILRLYDEDAHFHDQVNRYIHDFEAMLRGILAQRDGSPLAVTLLSSDMGKLYVALAQAIERLRA